MYRRGCVALVAIIMLAVASCGPSLTSVNGVVKLDGTPVEGATVTFVTEDGKQTYSGFSDGSGNFSVFSEEKKGIPVGTYKVTVVKTAKVKGAESMTPGSSEYLKQMETERKEADKAKVMKGAIPGVMPKAPKNPNTSGGVKSELPSVYGAVTTTPFTIKLPPDQPIVLELKSKP